MSLDYQPFADTPALDHLHDDLRMNVSDAGRVASALAGFLILAAASPLRFRPLRFGLILTGGAFLLRACTGICPWYRHSGIDRRHPTSGVAGNSGVRAEHSIEIHRSPKVLYNFWRPLDQLPRVMRHVESVRRLSDRLSVWNVKGPLGTTLSWEAEIINDGPGELIAWNSLPGARVPNAGSVRFEPTPAGGTLLKVAFQCDPPAGSVGAAISSLLGCDPQRDLENDLAEFKFFAERELAPFSA